MTEANQPTPEPRGSDALPATGEGDDVAAVHRVDHPWRPGHPPHDDPATIIVRLPERYHAHFNADHAQAARAAAGAEVADDHAATGLCKILNLWTLRSILYTRPGHDERIVAARSGRPGIPIEDVVPDWPERLTQHRQRPDTP